MHHRRGFAGGEAAGLPLGRPARDGFHRRARAGRHPEEAAGRRRRHHRPGNGDRVPRAGQRSHRGRVHGPADAGRRPGPGQAARRSPEEAGRRRAPQDQGRAGEAQKDGIKVAFESAERQAGLDERRCSIACWSRWAARRTAASSMPTRPASRSPSAASFRSTGRCAPTCRTSSRSATSSVNPMLAHKATHEGKLAAEVAAGEKQRVGRARDSVGGLHRSGNRLGRRHRDRSEGEGPATSASASSRGRRRAARSASAAPKASPS